MKQLSSIRSKITAAVVTGVLLSSTIGCTKEEPLVRSDTAEASGTAKSIGQELFSMVNFTGPCRFNVKQGCNSCYGILENNSSPGANSMRWVTQNATTVNVEGFYDPGCNNSITCPFTKGPGLGGPEYYIIPNQGPAVGKRYLRLRARNGTVPNWTTPAFTYNVTSNTWTIQAFAAPFFTTAQVTTLPAGASCCIYC